MLSHAGQVPLPEASLLPVLETSAASDWRAGELCFSLQLVQVYSLVSWSCCLLQTPERFEQLARAVPARSHGVQPISAGYWIICPIQMCLIQCKSPPASWLSYYTPQAL